MLAGTDRNGASRRCLTTDALNDMRYLVRGPIDLGSFRYAGEVCPSGFRYVPLVTGRSYSWGSGTVPSEIRRGPCSFRKMFERIPIGFCIEPQ